MTVNRGVLITLERVFDAARPWEGCALLLGHPGVETDVQQIWPCLNSWPEPAERQRRFAIDPREQLLAQRWARQRQLAVIGSAHSHPCSSPVPSAIDLELAVAPTLLAIAGPPSARDDGRCWDYRFWWLDPQPVPLPWTMAD